MQKDENSILRVHPIMFLFEPRIVQLMLYLNWSA